MEMWVGPAARASLKDASQVCRSVPGSPEMRSRLQLETPAALTSLMALRTSSRPWERPHCSRASCHRSDDNVFESPFCDEGTFIFAHSRYSLCVFHCPPGHAIGAIVSEHCAIAIVMRTEIQFKIHVVRTCKPVPILK